MSNPIASDNVDGFRAGLARGELMLAACSACETVLDYSARMCTACASTDLGWRKASGTAEVRCVVEISVSYTPSLPAPFLIASVKLEEGPHLLAPYYGIWESTYGGQSVVACFEDGGFHFRSVAA